MLPMSTWTPKDGQTYEIVDAAARERIDALEQSGGGSSLPEVTASDNGKVLGVVNGEWAVKADEGGASVTVDSALSSSSENPVQNKVIKAALDGKGTYSKPSGGIPKSDLASDVQTSLGKADTALQQHQSLAAYRTSAAQDTIDAAQDTAIAAKYSKPSGGIPASDLAAGVIPTVPANVSAFTNDAGYLTQHQSLAAYQTKSITDTGGYYTTDTVDGALQEIGAELAGVNTLIGTGVIT